MAVSITKLLKTLDKTSVLSDVYTFLGTQGLTTTALQPGEPIPVVLDVVVGWVVDKLWNPWALPALQAQFGDHAKGDWLTLLAATLWRRPRIEAQAGTMTVVLENRGSFFGTKPAGSLRAKHKTSGKTYSNTTSVTFTAYTSGPYPQFTATFEADEAGTASNAQPGDLATYSTPLVAGPVNVFVVSNTVCLGSDEEADGPLLDRGRAAVGELSSSGPLKAYESVAKDPTGAFTRRNLTPPWALTYQPAIARVRVVKTGPAAITVYLASNSGPAGGDTSTPNTDVFAANLALQLFVVPPGVTATATAATSHTIALGTITLDIDASSGVTAADAIARAQADLDAFFATLPIGGTRKTGGGTGYVWAGKIQGVLESPSYVVAADFTFSDTALAAGDVAVPTYTLAANIVDQS